MIIAINKDIKTYWPMTTTNTKYVDEAILDLVSVTDTTSSHWAPRETRNTVHSEERILWNAFPPSDEWNRLNPITEKMNSNKIININSDSNEGIHFLMATNIWRIFVRRITTRNKRSARNVLQNRQPTPNIDIITTTASSIFQLSDRNEFVFS